MTNVEHPLIERVERVGNSLRIVPGARLMQRWLLEPFMAEYDEDVDLEALPIEIAVVPYLLNVAPIVWVSGERFAIDTIDADLARSLAAIRHVFRTELYPNTRWDGEIVSGRDVSATVPEKPDAPTGALFSGGVDSVCTSLRHADGKQISISVQGADIDLGNLRGWRTVQAQTRSHAARYGHASAFVRSNFKAFVRRPILDRMSDEIPGWWGFVQNGMGLSGLCFPILFTHGSDRLLIAASHTEDFGGPWGSHPSIDNAIRVAGIRVEHDAYELSRQQKLAYIIETCQARGLQAPTLRVCYADPGGTGANCCRCEKCLRTITGLVVEGRDPRQFGFDTDAREALTRLRLRTRSLTLHMGENEVWMWTDVQRRAVEATELEDGGARELAAWVSNTDFQRYRSRSEPLWETYAWMKRRIRDGLRLLERASSALGRVRRDP